MIYKLVFDDRTEYAQAKNLLNLEEKYNEDFIGFDEALEVIELTDEQAKEIMLRNNEYKNDPESGEFMSLYDCVVGDDFCLIGSSEWID